MTSVDNPEIGRSVSVGGLQTNYHDVGDGDAVVLLHGSGPGVSAWANWRGILPQLSRRFHVLAPDIVGFGYTERPDGIRYELAAWQKHLVDFLDAVGLRKVSLVGNSFGSALALAFVASCPDRVNRLVLMGSAGVGFQLTEGLDLVWGYEPSVDNMRRVLDVMAYDRDLVNDELAELRYRASVREGVQEAYASMFPAPRQQWIDALATPEDTIASIPHETLVVHGREDRVLPVDNSIRLNQLIERSQLHVFGRCGHWTQIEQADRFTALVTSFLEEKAID